MISVDIWISDNRSSNHDILLKAILQLHNGTLITVLGNIDVGAFVLIIVEHSICWQLPIVLISFKIFGCPNLVYSPTFNLTFLSYVPARYN